MDLPIVEAVTERETDGPSAAPRASHGLKIWSEVDRGTATGFYTVAKGKLTVSDLTSNGTWTLYEDGSYNNNGQLHATAPPAR